MATPSEEVPPLVRVLGGNVVTAMAVFGCIHTAHTTTLRRLHPAVAAAVAAVPWVDTTTGVRDIVRWRAALPAAVGCKLNHFTPYSEGGEFGDADVARLPRTLRLLDVTFCLRLTKNVSFAHLSALESLDCSSTSNVAAGQALARLPPSLLELRMKYCDLPEATNFSHLRKLWLLEHVSCTVLSARTAASLPPSLEMLDCSCTFGTSDSGRRHGWPRGWSLAHLTRLRVLRMAHSCIDAPALATLPPSLHSLDLGNCRNGGLTAAGSLAHLTCLHTLNVSNSDIGDAVLATLPPSLVSLDMQKAGVGESLTPTAVFPHLPALRVLNVSGAAIGDAAVASMPPGLVELHMAGCANVTNRATLTHLAALRMLHSSGTDLAPAVIALCRARDCAAPADSVLVAKAKVDRILLASLPDGRLVSYTEGERVALWAAVYRRDPLVELHIDHPLEVRALAVLPDGHRVAIAVKGSDKTPGGIIVWDTRNPAAAATAVTRATVNCAYNVWAQALAVLRDGRLVVGGADGKLHVVDVDAAGVSEVTLGGHGSVVTTLAALADGSLASAAYDHRVWLWDVGAAGCAAKLAGHTDRVNSLAVLPDGRLASGSWDETVRLWDVGTRVCVGVLPGWYTRALVVLPDTNQLVSMSCDDKLAVWDMGAAAPDARTVELAGAEATALVPLPGGRLVTAGAGVRLWQLPSRR